MEVESAPPGRDIWKVMHNVWVKLCELTRLAPILVVLVGAAMTYNMRLPHTNVCVLRAMHANDTFNCTEGRTHYWSHVDHKSCYINDFGPTPCGIDELECGKSSWYGGGVISFAASLTTFAALMMAGRALNLNPASVGHAVTRLLTMASAVCTCIFVIDYLNVNHCTSVLALTASTSSTGMFTEMAAFFMYREDLWQLNVAYALMEAVKRVPKGVLHVLNQPFDMQRNMMNIVTSVAAAVAAVDFFYWQRRLNKTCQRFCRTSTAGEEAGDGAPSERPQNGGPVRLGLKKAALVLVSWTVMSVATLIGNKMLYTPSVKVWDGYNLIFGPLVLLIVNIFVATPIYATSRSKNHYLRNTGCGILVLAGIEVMIVILMLMVPTAMDEKQYGQGSPADYMHATAMYFGSTVALEVKVIATYYLGDSALLVICFVTPGFLDGAILQYGADIYEGIEAIQGIRRLAAALALYMGIVVAMFLFLYVNNKIQAQAENETKAQTVTQLQVQEGANYNEALALNDIPGEDTEREEEEDQPMAAESS